jgi:hypothetical protein
VETFGGLFSSLFISDIRPRFEVTKLLPTCPGDAKILSGNKNKTAMSIFFI